jgi:hypothetical protein
MRCARGRARPASRLLCGGAAASTICNALPAPAAPFQRVVNVTNMPAGGTLCSAGWQCKRIEILVTRPGSDLVALDFMLVNY